MEQRHQDLKNNTAEYLAEAVSNIKNVILSRAKKTLNAAKMKERIREQQAKRMAKNIEIAKRDGDEYREDDSKPLPDQGEDGGFRRGMFGSEKPVMPTYENKPRGQPRYTNKTEGGFSRSGFGQEKTETDAPGNEEERKDAPPSRSGPPVFGGKSGGPIDFKGQKPKFMMNNKSTEDSGFNRGPAKPKTGDDAFKPKPAAEKPKMRTRKDKAKNKPNDRFGAEW